MSRRRASVDLRGQRGQSLTELTVVLALFALLMIPTVLLWGRTQETYFVGSEMSEAQANLRVVVDGIAQALRRAGHDLTGCGFDPIPTATATTLELRSDLND